MSGIRLKSVHKSFGSFQALKDINLEVKEGEFITLLGASGSGKTTCLRTIAGFCQPDSGHVFIGDEEVTRLPANKRNIGVVFQHYALFPHMTVFQNIAYGLVVRGLPKAEIKSRTAAALELVHLSELADRYPKQLSGGQKQRVALARAVIIRPRVLLLDEPLGALDLKLREELQVEIRRVQKTLGITTVNVTHDQGEALSMSDRIAVMADGEILQIDTPTNLYRNPNSIYVAKFVGKTNSLMATVKIKFTDESCELTIDGIASESIEISASNVASLREGDRCILAFRPEDVRADSDLPNKLCVKIEKVTYLGNGWVLTCEHPSKSQIFVELPALATPPSVGGQLTLSFPQERCQVFKADGRFNTPIKITA